MRQSPFLVAACPRSGTKYMAELLVQLGLDVLHERVGSDGCVSWLHAADLMTRHYWDHSCGWVEDCEWSLVVHQVRSPIKTVSSLETINARGWQLIEHAMPGLEWSDDPWIRRAEFYIRFNEFIESKWNVGFTYRVEDIDNYWSDLCDSLGLEAAPEAPPPLRRDVHAKAHANITWGQIEEKSPRIYDALQGIATRYGYSESHLCDSPAGTATRRECVVNFSV